MSEADTSRAAFAEVTASGDAARSRQNIIDALTESGPLTAFELEPALLARGTPTVRSAITARIDELQKKKIVGSMPEVRRNPETEVDCLVYGLVKEHGAEPRFESDRIEVKINEKRYYREFACGTVPNMTKEDIAFVVRALILEAKGEI